MTYILTAETATGIYPVNLSTHSNLALLSKLSEELMKVKEVTSVVIETTTGKLIHETVK